MAENKSKEEIAENKSKEEMKIEMRHIDAFDVPETEADRFIRDREICAEAAQQVMAEYCPAVYRREDDPAEGEAIVGYFPDGEVGLKVLLDPFEVPVMKIAIERGRLKEYILAANGLTEEDARQLSEEE